MQLLVMVMLSFVIGKLKLGDWVEVEERFA